LEELIRQYLMNACRTPQDLTELTPELAVRRAVGVDGESPDPWGIPRSGGLCHALGLNRLLDELLDVLVE
jgi:hypothetical protein